MLISDDPRYRALQKQISEMRPVVDQAVRWLEGREKWKARQGLVHPSPLEEAVKTYLKTPLGTITVDPGGTTLDFGGAKPPFGTYVIVRQERDV